MTAVCCLPYGQAGYLVELGVEHSPERAAITRASARALRATIPNADIVVGAGVVAVFGVVPSSELEARIVAALEDIAVTTEPRRTHVVRAIYDGPDLLEVVRALRLRDVDELVSLHTEQEWTAELLGFLPGFAYLAGGAGRLAVPRKSAPRPRVAAGSIALAGGFSGIYPFDSPGGWQLLGRALAPSLFDPERPQPQLFSPGDRVRFQAVGAHEAEPPAPRVHELPLEVRGRALVVEAAPIYATVQDEGRSGQLAQGLPPSGALDPELYAAAQRAVGNPSGVAAIEIWRGALTLRARGALVVSVDGQPAVRLADGEAFVVAEGEHAVRYLAVGGGVDVPARAGSRSTLLVARLGGFLGRPLRRGDVVAVGDPPLALASSSSCGSLRQAGVSAEPSVAAPLVVDPGPHLVRFPALAFERFLGATFRVSALGDRVGQRLEGPRIEREGPDTALPVPMQRGAVQITTDGIPIVLGPDHPTTGGYPVLAVLRRCSWGELARRHPGQVVRFVAG